MLIFSFVPSDFCHDNTNSSFTSTEFTTIIRTFSCFILIEYRQELLHTSVGVPHSRYSCGVQVSVCGFRLSISIFFIVMTNIRSNLQQPWGNFLYVKY